MGIKITKRLKNLAKLEEVKPTALRLISKFVASIIISTIESGRTPVQRGARGVQKPRYDAYSDSYKDGMGKGKLQNKRQRPVNLKVTGDLHRSIRTRKTKDFVRVWFTDAKAKYHDKLGAGKKKVIRRLVPNPQKGEKFNARIQKLIVKAVENAVKLSKR